MSLSKQARQNLVGRLAGEQEVEGSLDDAGSRGAFGRAEPRVTRTA